MVIMSQEKVTELLYKLIERELDRPENETDVDLIAECTDYLEELQTDDYLSESEILSRLNKIRLQVSKDNKQC